MAKLKGKLEYEKFQAGCTLSRRDAIAAFCYQCNGGEPPKECKSGTCPLMRWTPYQKKIKKPVSDKLREHLGRINKSRGDSGDPE